MTADPPSRWAGHLRELTSTRRVLWVAAFLATPVLLLLLLQVRHFSLQNGVDPFIYIGYQQDTPDLVARYGWQYFAVRFGLLWPADLASSLVGTVPGYWLLRYALALAAFGSLVLLGRSWRSLLSGWAGGLALLISPVFIASLMTVYSDTVGLSCLVVGTALLLCDGRHGRWRALAAGLFFGVAFHSNFFVVLPLAGGFGLRALLQVARREWRHLADYLVVVAGVVVVTLVGILGYRVRYGTYDVLGPSIEAARKYSGDAGLSFRQNNDQWLSISPHLYIPVVIATALLAAILLRPGDGVGSRWRRWSGPGAADALVVLVGTMVAYVVHQWVLGGYSVETFYYFSYGFAASSTALVMLLVELSERGGHAVAATAGAAAVLAPLVRNLAFEDLEIWVWPWVPLLSLLVLAAVVATRAQARGGALLAGSLTLVVVGALAYAPPVNVPAEPGASFRFDPHYESMLGDTGAGDLDIYRAATDFADAVPKWRDDPGTTIYWYDSGSPLLNAAQATQYWRTVALQELGTGSPRLTPRELEQLQVRTPRHLVVLSETREDATLRAKRVAKAVPPLMVTRRAVGPPGARIYLAVLTFEPVPCDVDYRADRAWLELLPCP